MHPSEDPALPMAFSDTLQNLRELFDAIVEVPEADRDAWLAAHVADADTRAALRELIAADQQEGFLETPAAALQQRIIATEIVPEGLLGRELGGFRLVRVLGQGGMAAVFLGERTGRDFVQRAAVKLLRRGLYSELEQRLFLRERQVLASLDHPNIAHFIDGGVTEAGIPFLVLEYVDGLPITRYAVEQRLDVRARLELFLSVCRAVEAAHRALIVHRDIKPSNILVTATGDVKLLDFGIAKLVAEDSLAGTATVGVFTPDYAAPEQLRGGAITTATDVYGLGVLLHELLLGLRPEGGRDDDSAPRRPSSRTAELASPDAGATSAQSPEQLRRQLRGDLDNILLKALEADPARRYASAGAFADDIARHLEGRPVSAHPPTRWYRTRKFISRHRGGVTVTAILVLAVVAALGLALWQARVAEQQSRVATAQATRAEAVKDVLVGLFNNEIPRRPREKLPDTTMLDEGARRAQSELAQTPAVGVEVLTSLGHVYLQLAMFDKSEQLLDLAVATARRFDPADPALLGEALAERGDLELRRTRYAQALSFLDEAVMLQRALDPEALAYSRILTLRALAYSESGKTNESIADYEAALAIREKRLPADDLEVTDVHAKIGSALDRAGRHDEATPYVFGALEAARSKLGEAHVTTTRYMKNYAVNLMTRRRYAEAIQISERSVELERTLYPPGHPSIANGLNNLGFLYLTEGRLHDAQSALEEVRSINRNSGLDRSRGQNFVLTNLAAIEEIYENRQAAIDLFSQAAAIAREVLGEDHELTLRANLRRARAQFDAKPEVPTAKALEDAANAISSHPEKLGQFRTVDEIDALTSAGRAEEVLGDSKSAATNLRSAVAMIPADFLSPSSIPAVLSLARFEERHEGQGDPQQLLRDFIVRAEHDLPKAHYAVGELHLELASILVASAHPQEAAAALAGCDVAFAELAPAHSQRQRLRELQAALVH